MNNGNARGSLTLHAALDRLPSYIGHGLWTFIVVMTPSGHMACRMFGEVVGAAACEIIAQAKELDLQWRKMHAGCICRKNSSNQFEHMFVQFAS